jgi:signal transduction histidine kinase
MKPASLTTSKTPSQAVRGLALVCGLDGTILTVLRDTLGFHLLAPQPRSLAELTVLAELGAPATAGSAARLAQFFAEAVSRGVAQAQDIWLDLGERRAPLTLFGLLRQDRLYVLASEAPEQLFSLMEDTLCAEGGQDARPAPEAQAQNEAKPCPDLDEFTRLNNELLNSQRMLAKQNLELARQEMRFRMLLRDFGDALAVVDKDGLTLFVNPATVRLLGRSETELMGQPFPVDLSPGDPAEIQVQRPDGTRVPVEAYSVWSEWEGRPALVSALRDITARHEAEQARADVERILQHDLKAPLSAIINLPQLLLMEAEKLDSEQREYLQLVETAGKRMLHMITHSLDLGKMERGVYVLEPQRVDLLLLTRMTLREQTVLADRRGVFARITVNGRPPETGQSLDVRADPTHLSGLLANLLINALEAAPRASTVRLDLREQGGMVELALHNQGAVPKVMRERFFDKYATSGKSGGTGLGTYSARLVARAHGGEVTMQTSEDDGTTLTLTLPLFAG